ncbi:DUF6503 family protein [Allomuricauda sp. d1]|uniref:DUF6503 family protein n=1 Tax=Allomuricauda sp. d1 TaxID=3136725 RepID=UPI0031D70F9A
MKIIPFVLSLMLFVGCKQISKENIENRDDIKEETTMVEKDYPEALKKVFEAHGGLKLWKQQRTLQYTMPKADNPETHTTDLWTRHDKIETPNYSMGFDGKVWILDTGGAYEGNPEFYHNLMFYFYAMPFVLADGGINYGDTEPLEFEGKSYPGIQITYDSSVGTSPKDEYYIHFDPETHQMAWLGYTVTYRTGEDSDNIKWIRYDDWMAVDGLVLPQSISWYNYEGRQIKDLRNKVPFEAISLSEEAKPKGFYQKPTAGMYYKKSQEK